MNRHSFTPQPIKSAWSPSQCLVLVALQYVCLQLSLPPSLPPARSAPLPEPFLPSLGARPTFSATRNSRRLDRHRY